MKSNNLSLNEAIGMAENRALWRLMSAFDATRFSWCMLEMKKKLRNCRQ